MIHGQLMFMATAVCAISAIAAADTINVPVDHPTIQTAIDAALDGDTVIVAPGTYLEAINFNGKAITVASSDGPEATTISAKGLDASVVTCASGETADAMLIGFTIRDGTGTLGKHSLLLGGGVYCINSSPMITNCMFSANACYDGGGLYASGGAPHLVGCSFVSNVADQGYGGGLFATDSDLIIEQCTFENNCCSRNGGGVYAQQQSSIVVTDSSFVDNSAFYTCPSGFEGPPPESGSPSGGGMYCESSTANFTDCVFTGNHAFFWGGGVGLSANATFANCLFQNNEVGDGGGIGTVAGNLTIDNCTFLNNTAAYRGGAVYYGGGFASFSFTLTQCSFVGNMAISGDFEGGGGALNFYRPTTIVEQCTFQDNIAARGGAVFSGGGGPGLSTAKFLNCSFEGNSAIDADPSRGITGGGAAYFRPGVHPRLTNCLFVNNSADVGPGGAMIVGGFDYSGGANPVLVNCTFADNSAPMGGAGAIFVSAADAFSSNPTLTNCIVWNNGADPIVTYAGSTTTVTFSDVQGGFAGTVNLDVDPLFIAPAGEDYTLQFNSMCIDAGDNAAIPAGVTTDLAGNPRIINKTVDMGAYESPIPPCFADFMPPGGDGTVDTADLLSIINHWGSCPQPPFSCDADIAPYGGNGVVNTGDLLAVVNSWGPCP